MTRERSIFVSHPDEYGEPSLTADQVIGKEDEGPVFSGLYDARGNRLYRPKEPMGFAMRKRN